MVFAKVIAQSVMNIEGSIVHSDYTKNASNISGMCANVCYSNGYTPESIESKMGDNKTNIERFMRVSYSGHHSIADHAYFSVYLGGISKMMAMILNSFEFYTTSERSARYTSIEKTASEIESKMYNKWKSIIYDRITSKYSYIEGKRREKIAMENARYFISCIGKYTSMVYTTSFRQWSYIAKWFIDFIEKNKENNNIAIREISDEMEQIRDFIIDNGIGCISVIDDIKNRKIGFIESEKEYNEHSEQFGEMYKVKYRCSLACLAQAQRHRTLKYVMSDYEGTGYEFYVPHIVEDMREEWIKDMIYEGENGIYPQGIIVSVIESGDIDDLILKCEERICGRAQIEVAESTANIVMKILKNTESEVVRDKMRKMFIGDRIKAKCEMIGKCNERCEFGAINAVNREI